MQSLKHFEFKDAQIVSSAVFYNMPMSNKKLSLIISWHQCVAGPFALDPEEAQLTERCPLQIFHIPILMSSKSIDAQVWKPFHGCLF